MTGRVTTAVRAQDRTHPGRARCARTTRLLLLLAFLAVLPAAACTEAAPPPHILLLSIDTLRADHLGCYGYGRDTSPFLDSLAAEGVRFEEVVSQAPRTAPAHMSLFTSLYPSVHETRFDYAGGGSPRILGLSEEWGTLPEWLREAGYATAAWTGGAELAREAGFERGFDEYRESLAKLQPERLEQVRKWFGEHADRPCFLFLHTYQVHDPYLPPEPYDTRYDPDYDGWIVGDLDELLERVPNRKHSQLASAFWRKGPRGIDVEQFEPRDVEHLLALYDGGIRYTDDTLRDFFADLERDGLLANTVVAITSDHGEEFLEHGAFLHRKLYRETVHVPLVLSLPGRLPAGLVIPAQVRSIDVAPTLLELAGAPLPSQLQGASLLPLIRGDEDVDRPAFSEEPWLHPTWHRGLRTARFFLYDQEREGRELFERETDRAEEHDLAAERPELALHLAAKVRALADQARQRARRGREGELSEERLEDLRGLGYVR